ncbi:MAG: S-layer homology domain-containing protein [Oscillospiraceae bacterium]|nr:S-layer homology domain-containing protein [Oscillospiraceae bacterium]
MKKKALAIVLALCMALSMLPVSIFATQPQAVPFRVNDAVGFDALPEAPAELNGEYSITKSKTGPGIIHSNPIYSADAGDEVLLMVNPDPGYTAYVDDHGLNLEFLYIGYNTYRFIMPACDVTLDFYFEALEGPSYSLDVNAAEDVVWSVMDGVTSAKESESVLLFLEEREYYTFDPETDVTANCEDFFYLGMEGEERHVYELFMPAHDVTISINTTPQAVRHYIDVEVNNSSWGGASVESGRYARVGETVTFYAEPHYGCRLVSMYTESGAEITSIGNHLYTFTMPDAEETIYVNFAENINPVSVIVETGIGGTATLDVTEAKETDQVMLHCIPDEGYRVAQITGVDEIIDFGGGYYLFTMPGEPVELKVLFLRNENPFLDINETQFFYDSVLWAAENGITGGVDDTHFGPAGVCNRAQVVTFLWAAAGKPAPTLTENPFVDIPDVSWYTDAVLWAYENGITAGSDDTHFDPAGECNRAQVVTFLWAAAGKPAPTLTENPFEDVPDGSWYAAPILWALENGITSGMDDTHFNPGGQCLRAFAVTFLHKAAQLPPVYTVSAEFDETLGTVTLSHTRAAVGEAVTVTAVPFKGCKVTQLRCESGADLYPLFGDDGYIFYMPDQNETIHVTFEKVKAYNIPPTDPDGQLYVLNLNSMCFHYPDCAEVEQINPWDYYEYTGLRESLIDHDYHPCNICQP